MKVHLVKTPLCFGGAGTCGLMLTVLIAQADLPPQRQAALASASNPAASNQWALDCGTFLGGDGSPGGQEGYAIVTDSSNHIIVAGYAESPGFPVTQHFGPADITSGGFVTKIDAAGRRVLFSIVIPGATVYGLAVDSQDNIYLTGVCGYYFTVTNAFQASFQGGDIDAFAAKLSADGSQLLYSTFLGGTGPDMACGIAVDSQGQAWVTGWTGSSNFPVTTNALQPVFGGKYDAFVTKLSASGQTLLYSTYLGGDQTDVASSVVLDKAGNVYVGGGTSSAKFGNNLMPQKLGPGGWQNGFVAKLNAGGTSLGYLTFFGGTDGQAMVSAIAVDALGQTYLFGETDATNFPVSLNCWQTTNHGRFDNFLVRLNAQGSGIIYSTYLGGGDDEYAELSYGEVTFGKGGLAVDSSGNAYVAARTASGDFAPRGTAANIYSGYYDGYVAKVNADGSTLEHLLYLGNSNWDAAYALTLDGLGRVLVTGLVSPGPIPPFFPITSGALVAKDGGNGNDVFITRLVELPGPPPNDAFTQRIVLVGPRTTVFGNNSLASKELGEPNHAGNPGGKSLWWSWKAPADGRLIVSTKGSSFDTLLAVYTNATLGALKVVAANDDVSTDDQTSQVKFPVQSGVEYQIALDGHDGASGSVLVTLTLSAPANDDFADRIILTNYPVTVSGSNVDASYEPTDPVEDRDVWWQWIAPMSGPVAVSTQGSSFDSYFSVYTNSTLADLGLVGRSDDHKQATIQAVAGTAYQINVGGGYRLSSGKISLAISPGAPPPNDNFANSIRLTGTSTNFTAYNYAASWEPGEPPLSNPDFHYGPAGRTVWWSWQAPDDGRVTISIAGSSFDARLGAFTGSALTNLQLLAWNHQNYSYGDRTATQVNFQVQSNAIYHIVIDGHEYDPEGQIQFALHFYHSFAILSRWLVRPTVSGFQIQGQGHPGAIYGVEASTNLSDWIAIPSPDLVGPSFSWKDTNAWNYSRRFYRWVEKKP